MWPNGHHNAERRKAKNGELLCGTQWAVAAYWPEGNGQPWAALASTTVGTPARGVSTFSFIGVG